MTSNAKRIRYAVACLIAFVLALFVEIACFTCGTVYTPKGESVSALDEDICSLTTIGYTQNESVYTPIGDDPQLRLLGIDRPIRYVLLNFNANENPSARATLYYAKPGVGFSEEDSVQNIDIPYAATQVLISLPGDEYEHIRIDVDGSFDLQDILLLSDEVESHISLFIRPVNSLRLVCVLAILEAFMIFATRYLLAVERRRSPRGMTQRITMYKDAALARPLTVLSVLMLGTACVVFFRFLFQNQIFVYADIGCDTQNVYYPFFMSLQRKLESGDFSLWDFTYGMGTNILTRQADVGSVFTWMAVSFGADAVKYLLPVVQILKILLSGYVCYFFLGQFGFSSAVKIIVSYIFAFNGFTMLWGQHYFFATAALCAVFVLFGVEKALRTKRGYLWLAVATCAVAINSYYFAYMTLLLAGVYALLRIIVLYTHKEWRRAVKKLGILLGAVCLGIGMAAFIFLPSVSILLGTSSRVGGGSLLQTLVAYAKSSFFDLPTLKSVVLRFFSNNLNGTNDYQGMANYYEAPQWFFSAFTLFFVFLLLSDLLLNRSEKIKSKLVKAASVCLILYLATHPLLSVVLNGFVTSFYRYTFLIMPVLALCFADMLSKLMYGRLRYPIWQIGCSMALSLALLLLASEDVFRSDAKEPIAWLVQIFMILLLALVFMIVIQIKKTPYLLRLFSMLGIAAAIIVNVGADSYVTTNRRTLIAQVKPTVYTSVDDTAEEKALEYVRQKDDTLYRVEKTYQNFALLNDSMLEGYCGVSTYNSVVNQHFSEFVRCVCPEMRQYDADAYYDFKTIYRDADLAALLGVKYIFSDSPMEGIPEYIHHTTNDTVYVYENTKATGMARFYTGVVGETAFDAMSIAERRESLTHSILLEGVSETSAPVEANASLTFDSLSNSSRVEGTIDASADGWLMLSIPYEDGWTAYVDGEKVELVRADLAFCAVPIEQGSHRVVLRYRTPMLTAGIAVSVACITAFTVLCVYKYNRKKDRKEYDSF